MTGSKPAPVIVSKYIEIPLELTDNHDEVTLCMDGTKVNGVEALATIFHRVMFGHAKWL